MKNKFKVVGVGEVLWDLLPDGKLLGGAPANFAYCCKLLGLDSVIISAVGNDSFGKEIEEVLTQKGLKSVFTKSLLPTGTVKIDIKDGIPSYIIKEDVAWDDISFNNEVKRAVEDADVVCFGTLSQRGSRTRHAVEQILDNISVDCLTVFDMNLRQNFYSRWLIEELLFRTNLLKLNSDELIVISEMFGLTGSDSDRCKALLENFGLLMVALTKGEDGSWLYLGKEKSYMTSLKVDVADTIGAGDAFTAALVYGILKKDELSEIHRRAVKTSAYICTKPGAMPAIDRETIILLK